MSNKLTTNLSLLKSYIAIQNPRKTLDLLKLIVRYFEDELSESEKDLAIHSIFSESNGLLEFLRKTLKCNKTFSDSNVEVFKLLRQIIDGEKKKIVSYASDISDVMIQYVLSTMASAKEKENAVHVLQTLVSNNLCQEVDLSQLVTDLVRIFNLKKTTGRFLQYSFELIGMIARDYPHEIVDATDLSIRELYFNTLEKIILKQEEISFPALTGALNGFTYFLRNFAPNNTDEPEICQRLYACVKKLSDPIGLRDRTTFRSSLNLFAQHSTIFGHLIIQDYSYWHSTLNNWISLPQWEDRKTAITAIHAFHREISHQIEIRNVDTDLPILRFFINFFKTKMESQNAQSFEIRIAIRGFGVMAAPCKTLLPDDLHKLLTPVMQRIEYAISQKEKAEKDVLEHYPDYVQALSQIMKHCNQLTGIQISSLQNIIIALIKDFHLLSYAHHDLAIISLLLTFINLSRLGGSVLDDVLQKVVLQGIIWTCSHKLVFDATNEWETITDWKENITYKSYLPLWKGFIADVETNDFDRPMIKRKIYEHMMRTLFIILDKLDLSTKKRIFKDNLGNDQELYFCDPNYDLMPVKQKDFHIFFNIVDFYRDILYAETLASHYDYFQHWICPFCEILIRKSIQNPLISGYLKLLRVGITIGNKMQYFSTPVDYTRKNFYNLVKYFLKSIIGKAQQTFGELQVACLELILSGPIGILIDFVYDLTGVILIALDIGHSMLGLANMALKCIEQMYFRLDIDLRESFLSKILPKLESYLQNVEYKNDSAMSVEIIKLKKITRVKKTLIVGGEGDSEMVQFQKKICKLLGSLEPNTCLHLISGETKQENLVKLDIEQNIRLKLYCDELKPTVYLDTLIPRICTLATTSVQRSVKIAACELVHACILYLLGIDKCQGKIWSELCDKMLLLSCDADVAVQQMFEPLLIQIIHYLSQRSHLQSTAVDILIDCLMDGISHSTNSTVRDMSAKCLREFLVWSIRQTGQAQMNVSSISIQLLLSKLKVFSFDSDKNKRRGAALAFNNLYRTIREEESCIDLYWMDLLYAFSVNFILTEELNPENGLENTYDEVSQSLDHITRVLHERRSLFNRSNDARIVPTAFGTNRTLKDAIQWLFIQCGNKNQNYRQKCISLFKQLATSVDGFNSLRSFIDGTQTIESILLVCEGNDNGTGLSNRRDLTHLKGTKQSPIAGLYTWLQQFLATLDMYTWLIGDDLTKDSKEILQKSVVFEVIVYYLEKICFKEIFEIVTSDSVDYDSENFDFKGDLEAIYRIETIKCSIIDRLIEFLQKVLPKIELNIIPRTFWTQIDGLIELIIHILFTPQDLELNNITIEHCTQGLYDRVMNFLITTINYLPEQFALNLKLKFEDELHSHLNVANELAQQNLNSTLIPVKEMNSVIGIHKIMMRINQFTWITDRSRISSVVTELLENIFNGIIKEELGKMYPVYLQPNVEVYANVLIKICFENSISINMIIRCILDKTNLMKSHNESLTISKGEHFLETFKKSIFEFLYHTPENAIGILSNQIQESNINYIAKILQDFTDYIYKHKQFNKTSLKIVVNCLLKEWPLIIAKMGKMDQTTIFVLVELMSHVALICPYNLVEIGRRTTDLDKWIISIISDKAQSLELKSRTIFLLPCIVGADDGTYDYSTIENALQSLHQQYFPIRSSEFKPDSLDRAAFINIFKTLLDALAASKSSILLKFIINATAADDHHILEWAIQECLSTFIRTQSPNDQVDSLKIPFDLFNDQSLEPKLRISICKRFLLNMIKRSCVETIIKFYTINGDRISQFTDTNYSIGPSGWKVEQALVNRIGAFQLIEVFMGKIDKEQIPRDIIAIGPLTRKALSARSEIFKTDDKSAAELFRVYQCAAYNALCALVTNTQDRLNYYNAFLFRENPTKNEYIWQNIINCTDDSLYSSHFSQDFDAYPKIKERIVSIKSTDNRSSREFGKEKQKYIQSQTVFDSSLSQDITKMDLSFSVIRTSPIVSQESQTGALSQASVILEKIVLNNHEVMPNICAVIQHMYENKITPVSEGPESADKPRIAPPWAEGIARVIGNSAEPKNVRLFLGKVIENCRNVFKHYARTMTRPLLQLLDDECAGSSLNYYNIDLIVMLLEWHDTYPISSFEEKYLASSIVHFFMRHCWHDRKQIFKNNLEIVKLMIELWQNSIEIPKQFLFDSITRSRSLNSKENICGLQLNAICVANDLVPWTNSTNEMFIQALLICLDNEYTVVYQPAAQLLGMCLSKLIPTDTVDIQDHQYIQELITKLNKLKFNNTKKFTDILFGVHKSFPNIVDQFLNIILNNIPTSSGPIKRIYLEMFLSRMDLYGNEVFREISTIDIGDLLANSEFQLHALHILNRALANISENDVKIILDLISPFQDSKKMECRHVMYEMLIFILQRYKSINSELRKLIIPILLRGLSDPNIQIQNRLLQFWSNEADLSNRLDERILNLFSKLYEPDIEKYFLNYSVQLLLQPAIQHPDSKRQIFEHQTDEEFKLKEYDINLNWRNQNSLIKAPLFIESQQKQLLINASISQNLLQMTTSKVAFEPTLDPVMMSQTNNSFSLDTQSSFLFSNDPQILDQRSHRVNRINESNDHRNQTFDKFRKRFLRDKEKLSKNMALEAADKHAYSRSIQRQVKQKRENHVTLYRRYRFGDYPDLMINSLALLLPLQALVKSDKILARQVLVSIFCATVKELEEMMRPFIVSTSDFIERIFAQSKCCDPSLFGALIEIALSNPKQFNLAPDLVAAFAKANHKLAIGILYLESRIDSDWDTGRQSSKRSTATITADDHHWLKLSDIYRALGERDIVAGIFSDKLTVDERIPRAIQLEMNNDFVAAQKLYLEVTAREPVLENDFAFQSYYNCFVEMGDWTALRNAVQQQLEDIEEIWQEAWNIENLLPHLIRSELREVLTGDASGRVFLKELERWTKSDEKWNHLKLNFGDELMMLHIANADYRRAKFYAEEYTTVFLSEWPNLNVLSKKVRANELQKYRTVSEIQNYAELLLKDQISSKEILNRWQNSKPNRCDSTVLWDILMSYRTFICVLASTNETTPSFSKCIDEMNFTLLDLALEQDNVRLSDCIIQRLHPYHGNGQDVQSIEWKIARSKHQSIKSTKKMASEAIQLYVTALRRLNDEVLPSPVLQERPDIHIKVLHESSAIVNRILEVVTRLHALDNSIRNDIMELTPTFDIENLDVRLFNHSRACLEQSIDLAEKNNGKMGINTQTVGNAYYALAAYTQDNYKDERFQEVKNIDGLMATSILRGMQYGSNEAQQLFPRLLQLSSLENSKLRNIFDKESSSVPEWMFLSWIPQIISTLRFGHECTVDNLFIRICRAYPVAIYYPFQLSLNQYMKQKSSEDVVMLRSIISLGSSIIQNPLIERFTEALNRLCVPELKLSVHLTELLNFIAKNENLGQGEFNRKIESVIDLIYPEQSSGMHGKAWDRIENYKNLLENLTQKDLTNDKDEINKFLTQTMEKLRSQMSKINTEANIQDFSKWFSQLQWFGDETYLEIPGQYTGVRKPIIQTHIKIVKFVEIVHIFKSLRKPIKFAIQGSDGRTYNFLFKYGEDLRVDQRIQQLLKLMSCQLANDRKCQTYSLSITTYQVVPINCTCGMISWVSDTMSMYELINKCVQRQESDGVLKLNQLRKDYVEFLRFASKDKPDSRNNLHLYGRAVEKYSRLEIIQKFQHFVLNVPKGKDLIKLALIDMCISPESFFALRNNFATSLATMNIAQWILGIGDRHLMNILLNTKTGSLIGIDFAICFGAGTRDLPIPELLPFRLTPHFISALNPLGLTGFITSNMIHTLRTFRANQKLIMACLEVFVREPTVDWMELARNRNDLKHREWEPISRINIAYRKLNGVNPRVVFEEDLQNSFISKKSEYFSGYMSLLKGVPENNIRTRLPDTDLTVQQQVQCLLDMATDPSLLGISYDFFQAWI